MNREVLDRWCQRGLLGLVLAILVFAPLATGAVGTLEFLIVQGLTVGVLLLWGLRLWLEQRPTLLWTPLCWAVLAFVGYALGRYLTADIEYVARQELLRVLVYACLFFAILNNLHRQESTQRICFTLIFLAMAISFYAGYQFVTGSDRVWHFHAGYQHRGSGTYISPNHLAGLLEMLLPLALTYLLVGRIKPLTKVLVGYAALVILVGIGVTLSRGSWIATGLTLVLLFGVLLLQRSSRVPALALLAGLLVMGCWLLPKSFALQERWKSVGGDIDHYGDLRFAIWKPAVQIWQENVWWGAGPAHFDYRFPTHRPEVVQMRPERVHNDYLNTLVDWGVVGTVLVAAAWGLLGVGVFQTWRYVRSSAADFGRRSGSNKRAFVLGASFGLVALLLHAGVDFNFHIPANALVAVTLMALLSSHLRFASERYWTRLAVWSRALATVLVLAGVGYLSWQGWRHGQEYVWLERANRAAELSEEKVACLEAAFRVEPKNAETALALGEQLRRRSQQGGLQYQEQARQAVEWFGRSQQLNPWDSHSYLGYGMCLDWLERTNESGPYFSRAEELDPNGYFTVANIGLHYMETGDFAAARSWFERSLRLQWEPNPIAKSYREIANQRLLEAATNSWGGRLGQVAH
jgi:O-antigen ligase/cytochrome c-type biogenesis protein CcmH/NrfG